jgi:hypothetical protein
MSDPENFLVRWSRRKQQTAQEIERDAERDVETMKPSAEAAPDLGEAPHAPVAPDDVPAEPAFDVATLPSIDSITADSDIRAFLAPGVPPELTRAALRRAWSADPKIRDFVGLADYDWDFNTPGAITGFGALDMSDALRNELARMVGRSLAAEAAEGPEAIPTVRADRQVLVETSGEFVSAPAQAAKANPPALQDQGMKSDDDLHNSAAISQREKEIIATQNRNEEIDNGKLIVRRSHGRALPK